MENNIIEFPGRRQDNREVEENQEVDLGLDENNLTEMLQFLTALKLRSGVPKQSNIEFRRKALLEPSSDTELIEIANNSKKGDWQAHPTYYDAIIAELEKRNLLPKYK